MGHELKVILQRIEANDYQDIDALLGHGVSLQAGLAGARTLFGNSFQPAASLEALTYFGDRNLGSVDAPMRARLRASVPPFFERDAGSSSLVGAELLEQT